MKRSEVRELSLHDSSGRVWLDFVPSFAYAGTNSQVSVLSKVAVRELEAQLRGCLLRLAPRERQVIMLRFGIDSQASTLAAIGRIMGLSGERVRQIQATAIARLRRSLPRLAEEVSHAV